MMTPARGALLLVPNTLDHGTEAVALDTVLARGVIAQAAALRHWAVEDARSARAFLKRVATLAPLAVPLQELAIVELPRARKGSHAGLPPAAWQDLLAPAQAGHDLGLLCEAGLPAVADPGADLVAAAHAAGLRVLPLAGPSALLLALAGSGLNGQSFTFVGYLPQEAQARSHRLRELEALSRQQRQTQLFIETPYRNPALTTALLATLQATTRLAIACGLTLPAGWVRCHSVDQWRRAPPVVSDRLPAVYALLAT